MSENIACQPETSTGMKIKSVSLKSVQSWTDSWRKILAIDEFAINNTQNSIVVFQWAIQKSGPICPLRERIMDHGSELGTHRWDENGD